MEHTVQKESVERRVYIDVYILYIILSETNTPSRRREGWQIE